MGITERKEREREEMRKLILSAAQKLFVEQGFEKVGIRSIADEIEYSPATIYLYYKDKNELLFALHQEGFAKLFRYFQDLPVVADPFERLIQMGHAYMRFAFENPELFDLMFIIRAPIDALEDMALECGWEMGHTTFQALVAQVQACIDAGLFSHQNAETMALTIWSSVHGLTALFLRKRMLMFPGEERKQRMDEAFTLLIDLLRKGL